MKRCVWTILLCLILIISYGQNDTIVHKDHDYYKSQFDRGTRMCIVGLSFVAGGALLFGISVPIINANYNFYEGYAGGVTLIVSAIVLVNIGIPISCAGGSMRANNRRAIKKLDKNMNLSFGSTRYGIGLTFRF